MSVFPRKKSKTQSSLNFLQSGPRKFSKSHFLGLAPVRRVLRKEQKREDKSRLEAPPGFCRKFHSNRFALNEHDRNCNRPFGFAKVRRKSQRLQPHKLQLQTLSEAAVQLWFSVGLGPVVQDGHVVKGFVGSPLWKALVGLCKMLVARESWGN